jgi:hypothetical protein
MFPNPLQVLLIDPDQNNGNSTETAATIRSYQKLHLLTQPEKPNAHDDQHLGQPTLFQLPLNCGNHPDHQPAVEDPCFWHNPNEEKRQFETVLDHGILPEELKEFLKLFYSDSDLKMQLGKGYQGRTHIGSVALKHDLEATANIPGLALRELIGRLYSDLQGQNEVKVFALGSVFGGTGAAGLPILPPLLSRLVNTHQAEAQHQPVAGGQAALGERLRFGCAMVTPYFSLPAGPINGVSHPPATKAALIHYANVPPEFQHAYLVGAPGLPQTNDRNVEGGQKQENSPHYVEIVAALAALDFFGHSQIPSQLNKAKLHFADSLNGDDLGVTWQTVPISNLVRTRLEQSMVSFTTTIYLYKNFFHEHFMKKGYLAAPWYKNNFNRNNLSLETEHDTLETIDAFAVDYLAWLKSLSIQSEGVDAPKLFNVAALSAPDLNGQCLGLGNLDAGRSPRHPNDAYSEILHRLTGLKLKPAPCSSVGLLTYLLHEAVTGFCKDNYDWKS